MLDQVAPGERNVEVDDHLVLISVFIHKEVQGVNCFRWSLWAHSPAAAIEIMHYLELRFVPMAKLTLFGAGGWVEEAADGAGGEVDVGEVGLSLVVSFVAATFLTAPCKQSCIPSPFLRLRWRRLRNSFLPVEHSFTQ